MTSLDPAARLVQPASPVRRIPLVFRWGWALALIALVAMAALIGHRIAMQSGMARLREAAEHRLDMLATRLDADLARFDYLPALLEMTPVVPALLDSPGEPALRDAVNRYLSGVNATAGAEMVYVLDPKGTSLAASDWQQPGTTVGQDLSFRPYVSEAIAQGRGHFYGVGITSGKPGYYLSFALGRGKQNRGLVTVKVSVEDTERGWRKLPGNVAAIDERGVVILSTREDLKYRPIAALDSAQRADIARFRPYGDATLLPLGWHLAPDRANGGSTVDLDGHPQLATIRSLQYAPWRLVALDDLGSVRAAANYAAVTAALAMGVVALLFLALWQRQRAIRQKLATRAALQAAHDNLESVVVARTAQLRATQSELVHAGKMGVLGQMSAAMVHELNQPLTALRTLSDSAAILLDQDRDDEVRGNLARIGGQVDRLASLTSRLKTFSYKSDAVSVPVAVARSVAEAKRTLHSEIVQAGAVIEVEVVPADLAVLSDEAVLESVIVNLLRNALEAVMGAPVRTVRVRAHRMDRRVFIEVADTGPGIAPEIHARLFEPFVTSKPAGKGLGLGLVISAELARAAGGSLRAGNRDEGGAFFVIELPIANDDC